MKVILALTALLLMAACGGGSKSSNNTTNTSANPPPPAAQTPSYPDLTQNKLLSDQELSTPALSPEPQANSDYVQWATDNHHPLRSVTYDQDFSDLAFLDAQIEGKRIVQLGESTHGSRDFNQIKVRLIKYLHQHLGYNIVAFESSLLACDLLDKSIETMSASEAMRNCIFGVWHTREVQELFSYIIASKSTENPLKITGFDIQTSTYLGDTVANYQVLYDSVISTFDASYKELSDAVISEFFDIAQARQDCYNNASSDQCQEQANRIQSTLDKIDELYAVMSSFIETDSGAPATESEKQARLALIGLISMSDYIDVSKIDITGDSTQSGTNVRDKGMADNLTALAETLYPDDKIIVWAHNFHISHSHPSDYETQVVPMGMHLKQKWQEQLYSIGLYMIRGENANNNRDSITTPEHENNSLEAVAYGVRKAALFLPFTSEDQTGSGDDWIHQPFISKYWGINDRMRQHSKLFDAVIVIDRSHMPVYL